jgi:RHS repeat-associated protein
MKLNQIALSLALSLVALSGLTAKETEKVPGVAAQPASYFYTGKPYDADLGGYTYNYRNYDPGSARWTTADPSGFPDGANNRSYVSNNPICLFDATGLDAQDPKTIAWVYWDGSYNNGAAALQASMNVATQAMSAANQNGSNAYFLSHFNTQLMVASSIAAIAQDASQYSKIILCCHGDYRITTLNGSPTYLITNNTASGLPSALGNVLSKVIFCTCYNAYSPCPSDNQTGIDLVGTLAIWAQKYTETYLTE